VEISACEVTDMEDSGEMFEEVDAVCRFDEAEAGCLEYHVQQPWHSPSLYL
jgi:hypothetical protein